MATYTTANKLSNATDADFRAWGSMFGTALTNFGWVKHTDTGQIDWLTVTRPLTSGSFMGYEIWRMADALQATTPIFMKLSFGMAQGATAFGVQITFGTSTNGSGTPTGTVSTMIEMNGSNYPTLGTPDGSGNYNHYFSGDTSSFRALVADNCESNSSSWLCVERTKDNTGANTSDGLMAFCGNWGGGINKQAVIRPALSIARYGAGSGCLVPEVGNGQKGSDVVFFPFYVLAPEMLNPSLGLVGVFEADHTGGGTASVTHYGTARTYRVLTNNTSVGCGVWQTTSTKPAILYV
jgi:hypothetical protein